MAMYNGEDLLAKDFDTLHNLTYLGVPTELLQEFALRKLAVHQSGLRPQPN